MSPEQKVQKLVDLLGMTEPKVVDITQNNLGEFIWIKNVGLVDHTLKLVLIDKITSNVTFSCKILTDLIFRCNLLN